MLETQLREELQMLQSINVNGENGSKNSPFTQGMKDMLKNVKTNVSMICDQPRYIYLFK